MNKSELESLIKERTLLKQLIKVNPSYAMLFNSRIAEIKMKVNSEYLPVANGELVVFLYQKEVADNITQNATELLKELLNIES